jgi:hypothetical protein
MYWCETGKSLNIEEQVQLKNMHARASKQALPAIPESFKHQADLTGIEVAPSSSQRCMRARPMTKVEQCTISLPSRQVIRPD